MYFPKWKHKNLPDNQTSRSVLVLNNNQFGGFYGSADINYITWHHVIICIFSVSWLRPSCWAKLCSAPKTHPGCARVQWNSGSGQDMCFVYVCSGVHMQHVLTRCDMPHDKRFAKLISVLWLWEAKIIISIEISLIALLHMERRLLNKLWCGKTMDWRDGAFPVSPPSLQTPLDWASTI